MPVNVVPHIRMTMLGKLGRATAERFSFGVNLGNANGTALNPTNSGLEGETYFADTAADAQAFFGRPATGINFEAVLETIKFAFIGTDGKYQRDPIVVDVPDTPGGIVGAPPPAQTALAVSVGSARRGPTGRGRFYLPLCGLEVSGADLSYSTAAAIAARDSAKTFLDALNNQPGVDFANVVVVVVSTKGYTSLVNSVRVGRVPDTIRSRRTSLPELYAIPSAVV